VVDAVVALVLRAPETQERLEVRGVGHDRESIRAPRCGRLAEMITCRVYREGKLEDEVPFDVDVVGSARAEGARVWLDAVDPSVEELGALRAALGLHELAIEDTQHWGHARRSSSTPTRITCSSSRTVCSWTREPVIDSEVPVRRRALLHPHVRRSPVFDFHRAGERLRGGGASPTRHRFSCYLLLDEIVDGYLDTVERLETCPTTSSG
jgi:Mg2+ and Co2+ transporter CorA